MEDIKTVSVGFVGICTQYLDILSPILSFFIGIASLVFVIWKTKLTILNFKNAKRQKKDI